jgi:nucleoside-diphosphate-sugar epimerase
MENTVLILGATGRMGRNAAIAFEAAGWEVRKFDRSKDTLWDAGWGASVIVNCWNPPYTHWASEVPDQTAQIIEVAKASGATVVLPGNVYVYGAQSPERFGADTPHLATNPLGRVRVEMEAAYKASGVQTIVVRAGDYIDTETSGNWFDMVIAKPVSKGTINYPAPPDVPHAFAFLPDVAATMVAMAEKRSSLSQFEDVAVPGYTLTGNQLAQEIESVVGHPVRAKRMAWWPIYLASVVWPLGRRLIEMRYLWGKPHHMDTIRHTALCPELTMTPLVEALRQALQMEVHPHKVVRPSSQSIAAE